MTTGESTMTSGRVELLSPDGLVRSPAFSHVAVVSGAVRTIYIGGQDSVRADREIVGEGDLAAQTTQILTNIETALAAAGAGLEHIVKWNVSWSRASRSQRDLRHSSASGATGPLPRP